MYTLTFSNWPVVTTSWVSFARRNALHSSSMTSHDLEPIYVASSAIYSKLLYIYIPCRILISVSPLWLSSFSFNFPSIYTVPCCSDKYLGVLGQCMLKVMGKLTSYGNKGLPTV